MYTFHLKKKKRPVYLVFGVMIMLKDQKVNFALKQRTDTQKMTQHTYSLLVLMKAHWRRGHKPGHERADLKKTGEISSEVQRFSKKFNLPFYTYITPETLREVSRADTT